MTEFYTAAELANALNALPERAGMRVGLESVIAEIDVVRPWGTQVLVQLLPDTKANHFFATIRRNRHGFMLVQDGMQIPVRNQYTQSANLSIDPNDGWEVYQGTGVIARQRLPGSAHNYCLLLTPAPKL